MTRAKRAFAAIGVLLPAHCIAQATGPASQDFQTQVVAGTPKTITLSYSFTGFSTAPRFALAYPVDFSAAAPNCAGTNGINCTISVSFAPQSPGLKQNAVLVFDASNNLVATTLLHGIGQASQVSVHPGVITTFAGTGGFGFGGDGGPANQAVLANPQGVATDAVGNVYIADATNQVVRKISNGIISTVVGSTAGGITAAGYSGDGGLAVNAKLNTPTAIAVDGAGSLYIADFGNNVIRKVDPTGHISTFAGGGTGSSGGDGLGDGGQATAAIFSGPSDVAVDSTGNVYIADSLHGLVRQVDLSGKIWVVAGGGPGGGSDSLGDGASATSAVLSNPSGIALDAGGNLYISDTGHQMIRCVTAGVITAVAGVPNSQGYTGDGGPALQAQLSNPRGIRLDAAGDVYIADSGNNVVREVLAGSGIVITVAGNGNSGYSGDSGSPVLAQIATPVSIALDSAGTLLIADTAKNVLRQVAFNLQPLTYGSVNVGTVSSTQSESVFNVGNQPLNFTTVTISVNFKQEASGSTDCSASATVLPGLSCNIGVAFLPASTGLISGNLSFTTNSLNVAASKQSTSLSGTGISGPAPQLTIRPASIAFGNQSLGTASQAQVVTLTNTGTATLNFTRIGLSGTNTADFSLNTCPAVLAPGASCSLSVTFIPRAVGARVASIALTDNLPNSPQAIPLTGTGLASGTASLSTGYLSFPGQVVGRSGITQTITLVNSGNTSLGISSVVLQGPAASDFNVNSNCGIALAPGSNCTVALTFLPAALSDRNASLVFTDTAQNSPQIVSVTGFGLGMRAPGRIGLSTNGDQKKDIGVYRPSQNTWWILHTTGVWYQTAWGLPGDIPVPGDYDGDGRSDLAIYRPSDQTWWIVLSRTGQWYQVQWGLPDDIPVPADYDGDGKTDIAVFRPSENNWYVLKSTGGMSKTQWGLPGDIPIPADYDGDGKADVAIYRLSDESWWVLKSTGGSSRTQWGLPGDVPVPGDYDGDGKADIAVYRPSDQSWWVTTSSKGGWYRTQWGLPGDVPVPGDYDGDGKADIAIYRPGDSSWWVIPSSNGASYRIEWGSPGDIPFD
jgi:hypothetical protein